MKTVVCPGDLTKLLLAAERFQALTEQQSPAWHANRHAHAQKFLFHFARKVSAWHPLH